jgi:cold shock CspA family protein
MAPLIEGTITHVRRDLNIGYITHGPFESRVFFRKDDLASCGLSFGEQLVGTRVKFLVLNNPKGPKATSICRAN